MNMVTASRWTSRVFSTTALSPRGTLFEGLAEQLMRVLRVLYVPKQLTDQIGEACVCLL